MTRKLGYLVVALSLTLPSWCADKSASIIGYVRNSTGAPRPAHWSKYWERRLRFLEWSLTIRAFSAPSA